jgi:enamine deaminase RidA (YjgF/YER057c/UK114 family)
MYPDKKMNNDLCMAVKAGNRVFLRGQTGFDLEGNMTGIGDPTAQAEMAMQCVKSLLEEAGSKLEHICKTTIYLTDRIYREEVYNVIGKHLKGIHVCSTGLIVQGLARPEMVMEIDVEAIIPENEN